MKDFLDIDRAREIVRDHYKSQSWKNKVDRMPDKQVYALFFSFCEREEKKRKELVAKKVEIVNKNREFRAEHGCVTIPHKVQPQKIPSTYGTPFLLSELERLRNGGFGGVHG